MSSFLKITWSESVIFGSLNILVLILLSFIFFWFFGELIPSKLKTFTLGSLYRDYIFWFLISLRLSIDIGGITIGFYAGEFVRDNVDWVSYCKLLSTHKSLAYWGKGVFCGAYFFPCRSRGGLLIILKFVYFILAVDLWDQGLLNAS